MTDPRTRRPGDEFRYRQRYPTEASGSGVCLAVLHNPTGRRRAPGERGRTIQVCLWFAERHGCGELRTCNLFARKDRPDGVRREPLPDPPDPVEVRRENDRRIAAEVARADVVLCAWGDGKRLGTTEERAEEVLALLDRGGAEGRLYALGFNRSGQPTHPIGGPGRQPLDPGGAFPVRVAGRMLVAVRRRRG
ncbi:MAG: DUF1643 domain-containing protein [Gammaproteobacteria bacterium]|nr:DUF1643 domain-containing protein [Gammaproteobacteria bacterium]